MDKEVAARFAPLVAKGQRLVDNDIQKHAVYGMVPKVVDYGAWRSQSIVLLQSAFGSDHPYLQEFRQATDIPAQRYGFASRENAERGPGILCSAQDDHANGYLWSVRERVHADVFDDFLEMAASLTGDGYKDAAAVIAGGTLEEHLRKLCQKHNVATTTLNAKGGNDPKKASMMNDDLAKVPAYHKNDWRAVQGWLDIRNNAAHGDYAKYTIEQVVLMIDGIRLFFARNPA